MTKVKENLVQLPHLFNNNISINPMQKYLFCTKKPKNLSNT